MSCLGTLIGATVGMVLGGPLGAIAGAAFGSWATSFKLTGRENGARYSTMYNQRMRPTEHAQMTFFVGAFSMLGKLAAVDGTVSPQERQKLDEFMRSDLNLDDQARESGGPDI